MRWFFNGPQIAIFTGSAPFVIGRSGDPALGSDDPVAAAR